MPYERAVSISVGSIPRTPSIVFSRIGNRQKKAMNEIFWRSPIEWSRRIEIGSRAGGGMARHHSMCGIASIRPQRERPSGIPMDQAEEHRHARSRLRSVQARDDVRANCEKSHMSRNSTRIVESRGKRGSSAWTVHACQADEDEQRHGDLRGDLSRVVAPGSRASGRCDGCQRSALRSTAEKRM